MIQILAIASVIAASLAAPVVQQGQQAEPSPCPSELPRMRSNLMQFLTGPEHGPARERIGLTRNDVRGVRVLSGSQDADVCKRLSAMVEQGRYGASPYRHAYYALDGFYFVTIVQEVVPGQPFRMGHTPTVIVFDRELKPLHAISAGAGSP